MRKFGYPESELRDYDHWVLLLRPAQVTLGSLVLVAKSDATAFGQLPPAAHAELSVITAEVEANLRRAVGYDRINYLMLMMVDPHVHFHIFPGSWGRVGLWVSHSTIWDGQGRRIWRPASNWHPVQPRC
jgi:diadenosine tetraphosphate (Ap4A) HIT family hydrolase